MCGRVGGLREEDKKIPGAAKGKMDAGVVVVVVKHHPAGTPRPRTWRETCFCSPSSSEVLWTLDHLPCTQVSTFSQPSCVHVARAVEMLMRMLFLYRAQQENTSCDEWIPLAYPEWELRDLGVP